MAETRPGSRSATDVERLKTLWQELGVRAADGGGAPDPETERVVYSLAESLRLGAVLAGPGGAMYFFDEAGTYVGYGAADASDRDYFVERGSPEPAPLDHDGTGGRSVVLRGRYAGLKKTHVLRDGDRVLRYFAGLPDELGNLVLEGREDVEAGDELRVWVGSGEPDALYEVTCAAPVETGGAVRILACRLREDEEVGT